MKFFSNDIVQAEDYDISRGFEYDDDLNLVEELEELICLGPLPIGFAPTGLPYYNTVTRDKTQERKPV